jgi:aminoglycoside phosphotransferase (APT) family kinase protein
MIELWDKVHSIWSTRPTTIIHGDLNTGNMWKNKADGNIVMADWQLMRMAPPALDFFTLFFLADLDAVGNGKWREVIEYYHALLTKSNPDVAEAYTVQHIIDDTALM